MDTIDINAIPFGFARHKILYGGEKPVDAVMVQVNRPYAAIFDTEPELLLDRRISELLPSLMAENDGLYWKKITELLQKGRVDGFEIYLRDVDRYFKIQLLSQGAGCYSSSVTDITVQIRQREVFKLALLSMSDGAFAADTGNSILFLNPAAERMVGISDEKARGKNLFEIVQFLEAGGKPFAFQTRTESISKQPKDAANRWNHLLLRNRKSGELLPVELSVTVIRNGRRHRGLLGTLQDVKERVRYENRISFMTYHDALTGLYNRAFFKENEAAFDDPSNLPLTLIMGDVNGLKLTNDAFGHLKGDELLKASAGVISSACRAGDSVIRWGGDEFIALLPKTGEEAAAAVCARIRECAKAQKIDFLDISISLGFAVKKDTEANGGGSLDGLLKEAEDRMYGEKLLESRSMKSRTIDVITRTLYERSREESRHAESVGRLCGLLGQAMRLDASAVSELIIVGRVHDIGKIGIDKQLLLKPGPLGESEWQEIRRHSEIGYRILLSAPETAKIAEYVLMHHERCDGAGYPNGKKIGEIPLPARILSVAEAYDAMLASLPYRSPRTSAEAVEELRRCAGAQFDPEVVEAFVTLVVPRLRENIDIR